MSKLEEFTQQRILTYKIRFFFSFIHPIGSHDDYSSKFNAECRAETLECPAGCQCEKTTVDCSHRGLKEIPRDIPLYTTEL